MIQINIRIIWYSLVYSNPTQFIWVLYACSLFNESKTIRFWKKTNNVSKYTLGNNAAFFNSKKGITVKVYNKDRYWCNYAQQYNSWLNFRKFAWI